VTLPSGAALFPHDFVHEAPLPALAGLDGLDDGMMFGVEMLSGVTILGIVTASHVAAGETQSQMHPGIAHLQAFLTAVRMRLHIVYLI
jgi:hypothetical protein